MSFHADRFAACERRVVFKKMEVQINVALTSVISALIGAVFGFISSLFTTLGKSKDTSKDILTRTVTSERAQWRNELRETAADFAENALCIASSKPEGSIEKLERQRILIRLRLNPKPEHILDANILGEIPNIIEHARTMNHEKLKASLDEFERNVQSLLKQEWEKSKKEAETGILTIHADEGKNIMSLKDKVAVVASIIAIIISLVTFFKDQLFGQHVLRASVVAIEDSKDKLSADILLVNAGKHSETLYKAQFIFSDDLSQGGGSVSNEFVGPVVLEPGKATVVRLTTANPDIRVLRDEGVIENAKSGIHAGVIFNALTPSGELLEASKIYRFTEFIYNGDQKVGHKPRQGDNNALIDLL